MKKKTINIMAAVLLGTFLFIGLGMLVFESPAPENNQSAETSLHYKLPQLIPTSWMGRK